MQLVNLPLFVFNSVNSIYSFFIRCRIGGTAVVSIGAVLLLIVFTSYNLPIFQLTYGSHCVIYDPKIETIAILCGTADLYDISDNLGPNHALLKEPDGVWILNANLIVGNSATLNINSTYTNWLKINSTDNPNPFHLSVLGNMNIENLKISSWDSIVHNYTAVGDSSPRPYIAILPGATGKTIIRNSEISFLGYNFPSRQGLSFYGGQAILENNTIHNQYCGLSYSIKDFVNKNNKLYNNNYDINEAPGCNLSTSISNNARTSRQGSADSTLPFVSIRYPVPNSTISSGDLLVEGTAFDEQSGVQKVELIEHTFPFNGQYPYELAMPISKRNWSTWQHHFNITEQGTHRILAKATDGGGNENWAETLIEITSPPSITKTKNSTNGIYNAPRLAVVSPLFTDAAYNVDGFYEFYPKFDTVLQGKHVTMDLNLLTSQIPPYDIETKNAALLLNAHLDQISAADISNISDEDVHQGYIFNKDGSNAYDALFLLHDEYATTESYSNLRQFVNNGGTVVFIDGNVQYAEVSYNADMHTVTLVRGHDWKFTGSFAEKNVRERWLSENREWIGSNFLWSDISAPITFSNNPFNYTHFEENYVTNPAANILLDYGADVPPAVLKGNNLTKPPQIASYRLQEGNGKVIMMGLYGQHLLNNSAFLKFFDNIVFPQAVSKPLLSNNSMPIYYYMSSGKVTKIETKDTGHFAIYLERPQTVVDKLYITIPKQLISWNDVKGLHNTLVKEEGKEIDHDVFIGTNEVGFTIPLSPETVIIEITAEPI